MQVSVDAWDESACELTIHCLMLRSDFRAWPKHLRKSSMQFGLRSCPLRNLKHGSEAGWRVFYAFVTTDSAGMASALNILL